MTPFHGQARDVRRLLAVSAIALSVAPATASATSLSAFFSTYANQVADGTAGSAPAVPATTPSVPLSRIAPADYADGVGAPVVRPNPRDLSNTLSQPQNAQTDARPLSNLAVAMMQLLASHEIAVTPTNTEDLSISVPAGDPVGSTVSGTVVMPQSRSQFVGSPRDQINTVTHLFDGSTVYGSEQATLDVLWETDAAGDPTGFMKTDGAGGLPIINGRPKAGDARADENPALQSLHALFLREHNRLAGEIQAACTAEGRICSGQQIFDGARQLVAATQEKIFYDELLPTFLNTSNVASLVPDPSLLSGNLGAINSFTAAAGRLGHTQVPDSLQLGLPGGPARQVDLKDCFFNANCLGGASMEEQLFGFSEQAAEPVDTVVVDALRNAQAPGFNATFLIDLFATNINRGRDHGLPDYMTLRAALGFANVPIENLLPQFVLDAYPDYATAGIDPLVGLFAEKRGGGDYIGETGAALWALQFLTLQNEFSFLGGGNGLDDFLSDVSMTNLIANNTNLSAVDIANPFLAAVPLPAGVLLLGSGLGLLASRRRRA